MLHSQHNCYDKALEAAGAKLKIIGDADEVLLFDLEGSFDERTAAVFFCPVDHYASAALPLKTVVEIAHAHGVPVIVDAARSASADGKPVALHRRGADMVVFSGGKTLRGPPGQRSDSGQAALYRRMSPLWRADARRMPQRQSDEGEHDRFVCRCQKLYGDRLDGVERKDGRARGAHAFRDAGESAFCARIGWIMVRWDRVTLAHLRMSRSLAPRKTSFIVCANSIFLSAWISRRTRSISARRI